MSSDEDVAAEVAGRLDAARAGLLQRRRQWLDTGELLTNIEAWGAVWRDSLGEADCALRRKVVAALAMAVFNCPGGCELRWRVRTGWNATMAGNDPAMVVFDTTSA